MIAQLLLLPLLVAGAPDPARLLPEQSLPRLDGESVALRELADGSPFLLDFWATWCLPCRQAFAQYAELEQRYAEQGFRVITVSQDDARAQRKIAPLWRQLGLDFPVLLDAYGALGEAMGVLNLPTSFLVDGQGQVVYRHVGYVAGDEKELEAQLRKLLQLEQD